MKNIIRVVISAVLIAAFTFNALPCGPSYISPIFDYEHAPEDPFANFAAGRIGILKPSQRRIVLLAAYRYLNGGAYSETEQKALVEVWNAEFNNKAYQSEDVSEAVRKWVEARKAVVGKDEKTPEIYIEREYGGYDFFPNCTRNAFETATATLKNRALSNGADDKAVKNWLKAQDTVFENCASGKRAPEAADESMPEWLRKDRAYQTAAAEFYSLNYEDAKRHFAEIALDAASPWQETAEYLVGRTLLRQASLTKDKSKTAMIYTEAEQNLSMVASKGGKYAESAENLLGLIKYRTRPKERVGELGSLIASQSSANFRQNLIDYNWLLDKFEKETLEAEDKRKEEIKQKEEAANFAVPTSPLNANLNTNAAVEQSPSEGKLSIFLSSDDSAQSWTIYVEPTVSDEEAIAEAEKTIGAPLNDRQKTQVREGRKYAYSEFYSTQREPDYQGGYWGIEKISLSLMPDFLRADELTNWLFTFQIQNNEAYFYALSEWRQTKADLWLLTALTKAEKSSSELDRLLEAADKVDRGSVAYPTIAFHKARILIEQNKAAEARKMLDDILSSNVDLPISSRNQFLKQRAGLSESLDDFLKFAQVKPFAFDWDGTSGTIDDFIKEQKSWYTPESYPDQSREEYEKEVEENFRKEKVWENRAMFDPATIEMMNQHFPLPLLMEAQKSPELPDYLRERFVIAVWTRAVLLGDLATAEKIAPALVEYHPELKDLLDKIALAKTPAGKKRAALYLILKNPMLTPFLEDGMGKTDNEFGNFDANDWWCAPYDTEYDETTGGEVQRKLPPRPQFLTAALSTAAQAERKRIIEIGDAPKYMGAKVLEWARLAPADKRVPESLFIVWEANGWTKYGCGNNEDLRNDLGIFLKKKYPQSEWAQKLLEEEKAQ